jgi:hypothetical protein
VRAQRKAVSLVWGVFENVDTKSCIPHGFWSVNEAKKMAVFILRNKE